MIRGRRDAWNLFFCSFTVLFIELTCIRWIPAYVRSLGFFTNFVLLASLLGIGLGILQARRRFDLVALFPTTLTLLVIAVTFFKIEITVGGTTQATQEAFIGLRVQGSEPYFVLPLLFAFVTVLFALLGQSLGRLLLAVRPPLLAYTLDVAGSVAGSVVFTIISFLGAPPVIWFGIGALAILGFPQRGGLVRLANTALLLGVVVWVGVLGRSSLWSPYYRIDVERRPLHTYEIYINNIAHQSMGPYAARVQRSLFYIMPFQTFHFPPQARELIIGAGSGADADAAVHNGIHNVTAVELDPTIYHLGRALNPDRIYQSPYVHAHIGDGRAFLEHDHGTYDLIVFALPDSVALTSSFAALRLESYLFTVDAFRAARRHLSANGALVLYNFYRQPWLVRKIAGMLTQAFDGQVPYGRIWTTYISAAVLMDGPRLRTLPPGLYAAHRVAGTAGTDAATDDWPFLYLKSHSIALIYVQTLALVWLFAALAVALSVKRSELRQFDPALFFTGAAFLLLEAKSIVNFTLLFGATWLVNALVVIGILATVLLANYITALSRRRLDLRMLYLGLGAALVVNLLVPFHLLLVPNLALRYGLACVVLFSPILLANLIFGRLFSEVVTPDIAFASNLIGAFVGGTCEYLSMQIGYHLLLIPAGAAYLLSFVALRRRGRLTAGRAALVR